ncbi:hypothetical protein [Streptomyces sp. SP18BB07]|uniref:hypothetical protein n=1 Tax=Streptomyces sp. SP18BB07 TaxID=3002522 RepID=UPI002E7833EF|nr:hypothetical protein [Streptomyces sp. SP18BB07]MEE1764360.1 hypothetical protein [Streptomyces sp. SP18BB07]
MPRADTPPIQINIPPEVTVAAVRLVTAVAGCGMVTAVVVLGTALYGPEEKSRRAYELLDRILGKIPQPQKPEPSPTPRNRTRPTARGESVRAATLRP